MVYDSDPHFSIDVDTRVISYQSPDKLMLIQGDHNSEVFTFDMPKEADGHNMMDCDIRQIHFINLDGERGIAKSTGIYNIDDMQEETLEDGTKRIVFSWTVSHKATRYVGSLSFAIKFACSGADATYEYVWNTLPYSSVPVSKSIENTDEFIGDYSDVLQDWYTSIVAAGQQGVDAIDEARRQAVANVQNALSNVGGIIVSTTPPTVDKAVAWLNPVTSVLRVKGEDGTWKTLDAIKGEPGGLNNVVQEFGDDEGLVISQKTITEKITELEEKDQELQQARETDAASFVDIDNRLNSLEEEGAIFNGVLNDFDSRIQENSNRISEMEQADSDLDEKISDNTSGIVSLGDAYTECSNRITEAEASISDMTEYFSNMNTETNSRIDDIQTYLSNKKTRIASGKYVGDGSSLIGKANYKRIDTPFKPMLIVIRDGSDIFQDYVFILDPNVDTSPDLIPSTSAWPHVKRTPKFVVDSDGKVVSAYTGTKTLGPFWYWIDDGGITWTSNMGPGSISDFNEEGVTYTWIAIGLEV